MLNPRDLLSKISEKEMYEILKSILHEDCYASDFMEDDFSDNFLHMLETYNIAFVASDERVLLTSAGQKLLFILSEMLI